MDPTIAHGDCLDILPTMLAESVDAIVTDPPYSLAFMGRAWDYHSSPEEFQAWCRLWASECLRVLKPGGHMLAFGGTRTSHRLACAIEDAGFEIRDSIAWLYGSGFPKSLDVSKAIDKAAGAEREVVGVTRKGMVPGASSLVGNYEQRESADVTAPATDDARTWQGWGTALKPAHEPIVVARKPLSGNVAANVLRHGTGALNVDGCRIEGEHVRTTRNTALGVMNDDGWQPQPGVFESHPAGRWPANVVLDESQAAALDEQSGETVGAVGMSQYGSGTTIGTTGIQRTDRSTGGEGTRDTGGASRFFYTAKAGSAERIRHNGTAHPTVKPLDLMRWLVRLVTPPGGVVLDLFAGSGTTGEACVIEGFDCVLIEREAEYIPLIRQRVNRRLDPAAYVAAAGDDQGLFGLIEEDVS